MRTTKAEKKQEVIDTYNPGTRTRGDSPKRRTTIYLEDSIFQRLRREAFDTEESMTQIIKRALTEYFRKRDEEAKKR